MARDDDDDAVSEERLSKGRKDRAEDDNEERPRKKSAREEEDDEDRPRKKKESRAEAEDDKGADKSPKPMPMRLVGAIIAALAWGFLTLFLGCNLFSMRVLGEMRHQRQRAEMEEVMRKNEELNRQFGGKAGRAESRALPYTLVATNLFFLLCSVVLVVGGIVLLMRKGFGKYIAMAAPVLMIFVEFAGFILSLIIPEGKFMDKFLQEHNVFFFVNIVLSLVVGGTIVFLLLNKDVSKALK